MKLVTYLQDDRQLVGVLSADGAAIFPLPYPDMNTLIETASSAELLAASQTAEQSEVSVSLSNVTLCAPIPRPRQDVLCLGINYKAHADEAERYSTATFAKEREIPIYFSKRVNEAVPPEGFIESHPGLVQRLDYESELAVIIGKTAKGVKAADAGDYIFGYTILNDVSARLLQTSHKQWYFGKGLDGFTPMGPCIVTKDEFAQPPAQAIRTWINGELRQDAVTDELIFGIPHIVHELSQGMTLKAGTVIATGTPAGVGMGFDPPKFLKKGDVVTCQIVGIGTLENTVE